MKFDKIILYNSLNFLNIALRQPILSPPKKQPISCFCGEKIALGIRHKNEKINSETIRIWRANSYFGLWYDDFSSGRFLAALDYTIHENHIKIEYMNIYDSEHTYYHGSVQLLGMRENVVRNQTEHVREDVVRTHMSNRESVKINHSLLQYMKNLATKENKQKVIVDVHYNLRIFNQYYLPEGFSITDRRSEGNRYWREAEFCLCKNE